MKRYIYFAYNITGIGGAQQYYKNRIIYLETHDFIIDLYSAIDGSIQIDRLKKHNKGIIPELNYLPSCIKKSKRESIIKEITNGIIPDEEVYVESVGGYPTLWAEEVAKTLRCKHICFCVTEQQAAVHSLRMKDFYYYKYSRKELYGIKQDSLSILFKGMQEVPVSKELSFTPACTDVIDEHINFEVDFPEADYNIGGIWRTNKDGFIPAMNGICEYFKHQAHLKFNFILIGSGSIENEKLLEKMCSELPNVRLFILGYLYPIPSMLIKKIDVFVSTAGSARVPMYCGKPSIAVTIDTKGTLYPLGIFNYTTLNTLTPEETGYSLEDYFRMVLIEKYCANHDVLDTALLTPGNIEKYNSEQMEHFYILSKKAYFNVMEMKPELFKDKINAVLCKCLGAKITSQITPVLHRLNILVQREK